jgi:pyruvate dehydrogenase E1 component beta subunit
MHSLLTAIPGIKVVMPSNAYDAKGLLLQAIRDDDPVMFLEHKMLYNDACDVPDGDYTIPFGEGVLLREGGHATVVATGQMVKLAAGVVDMLAAEGIHCDLIDPRTTSPLDEELILESVGETGRLVVVDESSPRCGFAADIAALAASKAFASLRAPVVTVTPPHTPVPFAPELERTYLPDAARIERAIRSVLAH